jgi:hypothetical protein
MTMKILYYILIPTTLLLYNCNSKSADEQVGKPIEAEGNKLLYDEVMKVHDEAMPKMNDMYNLKEKLKAKLESETLPEDKKQQVQTAIHRLDSASDQMMVWMRQFNPPADSVNKERAREYLENEMEKVKIVKEDILESLEKAEEASK